ncbi:hypothetical protein N7G274_000630 [Stereocaulon virgatum]|uniref:Uncharacterized protein n=1 Tax=Stereocaulon virgatum TaxID=373712 RepID=A0ABR4AVS3_9LECA
MYVLYVILALSKIMSSPSANAKIVSSTNLSRLGLECNQAEHLTDEVVTLRAILFLISQRIQLKQYLISLSTTIHLQSRSAYNRPTKPPRRSMKRYSSSRSPISS